MVNGSLFKSNLFLPSDIKLRNLHIEYFLMINSARQRKRN